MAIEVRTQSRDELAEITRGLYDIWAFIDRLLDAVPEDRWNARYGKDWTYADVPWHLAYFDRVIVLEAVKAGRSLPEADRFDMSTLRELNAWNTREFATRPAGYTPQQSIADLRAVHDSLRELLDAADDSLLEQPCFNHFFGSGFDTVGSALRSCWLHNWGEATELMVRLGRKDDVPVEATRNALFGYTNFMASTADAKAAGDAAFTLLLDMTGPGGGPYTIRVAGGTATCTQERPEKADVTFRADPVFFNCIFIRRMSNPMVAMLTGKVKVKGIKKMGRMQKIFHEPGLDDRLSGKLFL